MALKDPKYKDLNVRIPPEVMERLKDYAWTVNRPLTKVTTEALTEYLAAKKIKPRPKPEDT